MPKTRRRQRGGAYIGAGTYGCGFRPALRCDGEAIRRRGKFAKLVPTAVADEELALRELLEPRDPHRQYFLYPEAICKPAAYEASDEIERCKHDFADREAARVIIMGKGGENLSRLRLRPREYLPFFRSLRNLFQGLAVLHADGIAHMDVKPSNIVTRRRPDGTFHTRLIDFGLTVDPARLAELATTRGSTFEGFSVFRNNYLYWPFEVRFAQNWGYRSLPASDIHRQIRDFYEEIAHPRKSVPFRALSDEKLIPADVFAIIAPFSHYNSRGKYARLFPPADVHGLGITLAQIYYRFTGHRDIGGAEPRIAMYGSEGAYMEDPIDVLNERGVLPLDVGLWHEMLMEKGSKPLYRLFRAMTHRNPRMRPSMEAALTAYDAILSQIEEGLTPEMVTLGIKPWMLERDVLVEGATPAAAASSSSEVPASPVVAAGGAGARRSSSNTERRGPKLFSTLPFTL